jgi:hypothetical protein
LVQFPATRLGGIAKRSLTMAAFRMRTTIKGPRKAFGLDDATLLGASR